MFFGLLVKACQAKFPPRAYHLPNPLRQGCNKPSEDAVNQAQDVTSSGEFHSAVTLGILYKTHSLLKGDFHCPPESGREIFVFQSIILSLCTDHFLSSEIKMK